MLVGVGGNHGCTVFRVFSSGWGGGTQKWKLSRGGGAEEVVEEKCVPVILQSK